jgi:serine O-acetyltransferase
MILNNKLIPDRGQFKIRTTGKVPCRKDVLAFIQELTVYLFPILAEDEQHLESNGFTRLKSLLSGILNSYETGLKDVTETLDEFEETLPEIYNLLLLDAQAIYEGDPAASSIEEVIISYPGFYAILVYRIAHALNNLSVPVIPRILTEYAHGKTGIDINPGAIIGKSFCIDHGTGIVIGESAEIGNSVKIYQGVTLGAISVSKDKAGKKRHPTVKDEVTIYAGSTILGGETIIGHNSVIGGNVWLTHSVEPFSMVVNQNSIRLLQNGKEKPDYFDFVI